MKMNWRTVAVISLSLNVGVAFWVGRLRRPPQLGVPAPLTPPLLTALPTPQPVPGSMARTTIAAEVSLRTDAGALNMENSETVALRMCSQETNCLAE